MPTDARRRYASFDYQLIEPTASRRRHQLSARILSPASHDRRRCLPPCAALDLRCRAGRNPRSVELAHYAARWRPTSDRAYVKAVLDYLQHGGFEYTLTPPLLGARLGRRSAVPHARGLLRPLRLGVHHADARRRRAGARGHRLPGRRVESLRRLSADPAVRRARLDAKCGWTAGLGARRSDRGGRAATAATTISTMLLAAAATARARRPAHAPWLSATVQAWQAINAWWQDEFVGFNFTQAARSARCAWACRSTICEAWSRCSRRRWHFGWRSSPGARPRATIAPHDALSRSWRALERKLAARRAASAARGPDGLRRARRRAHTPSLPPRSRPGATLRAAALRAARQRAARCERFAVRCVCSR